MSFKTKIGAGLLAVSVLGGTAVSMAPAASAHPTCAPARTHTHNFGAYQESWYYSRTESTGIVPGHYQTIWTAYRKWVGQSNWTYLGVKRSSICG